MPPQSQPLVTQLAAALARSQPSANQLLTTLEQRLVDDRLAAATLLLFANDPASTDLQSRLAHALEQHLSPADVQTMLASLAGDGPSVRSHISAAEDALIQSSGHKVLAPPGSVDLETRAGPRGRIIDSPITIVGSGVPTRSKPSPSPRPPLPATLSTDGVHFSYGHALIIGVGQYRDPAIPRVATTANDARAIGELLRDPQLAAYPASQVRVLLDAQATRTAILDALDELAQRAAGGTALIFFAGHGELSGDEYVLLPFDAELGRLAATGINAARFHHGVAQVRAQAKRLLVLLNCCHAGGVGDAVLDADSGTLQGASPPPAFYRPLAVGSGQVVIASSRPTQKSGAISRQHPQHTPFGAQLLAALRGSAPGSGPAIGVFELFAALRTSVPADAQHIFYRGAPLRQEPLFYASQLDDNLAVALRPNGQGGTLGADPALVERLVALELQIEGQDVTASSALLTERDGLLDRLAHFD
ncbi:MAG: caspase family protein [Oscillochloridaceae bacterium umkhey_bin13]